jgi:Microtubule-binding stalk of dynein motor
MLAEANNKLSGAERKLTGIRAKVAELNAKVAALESNLMKATEDKNNAVAQARASLSFVPLSSLPQCTSCGQMVPLLSCMADRSLGVMPLLRAQTALQLFHLHAQPVALHVLELA